ncbi:unnamed protein product [Pedinophyceae sp. YPF-701]|nr:unnamed protein product [Pedinophyceae sp. YPF-701]
MEAVRQILDRVLGLSQSLGGLAAPLSGCLHIVKGALDLCLSLREQHEGIKALAANLPGVARVLGDLACTDGIHESDSLAAALKTLEEALNSCHTLLREWERTGKVKKAVKSWELQLAGATGQVSIALKLISASGVGLTQETRAEVMRMRKDLLCVISGVEQLLSAACHNSQQLDVLVGQVAQLQARSGGMSYERLEVVAAELRSAVPNEVERIMERHLMKARAKDEERHARMVGTIVHEVVQVIKRAGVGARPVQASELRGALEGIMDERLEPMIQRVMQQSMASEWQRAMEQMVLRVLAGMNEQREHLLMQSNPENKAQVEQAIADAKGCVFARKRRVEMRTRAPRIPSSEVVLGDDLSYSGGSAIVKHGTWTPHPGVSIPAAVKVLGTRDIGDTAKQTYLREAEVLFRALARSDRVCRLYGYVDDPAAGHVLLVMRQYEGSVMSLIAKADGRPMDLRDMTRVLVDVAQALVDMHAMGLAHMDVKPHNVLVDESGRAVLADFGLARFGATMAQPSLPSLPTKVENARTNLYAAPEQFTIKLKQHRGPASDVWAYAAMAHHMMTGRMPFEGQFENEHDIRELVLEGEALEIPGGVFCSQLEEALRSCLVKDPSKRPAATTLLRAAEAQLHLMGDAPSDLDGVDDDAHASHSGRQGVVREQSGATEMMDAGGPVHAPELRAANLDLQQRSPVARPPANGTASRQDISEDERVAQLQNMGFSRLDAEDAVELHGANLDAAADWILSGGPQRLAQGGASHTHATAWVEDAAVLGADLDTAVGWILSGGPQGAQEGDSGAQAAGRERQPSDAEVTHDSGDSDGESLESLAGALVAGGETGTWRRASPTDRLKLEFDALSCDPGSDHMEQPYMRIFLLNGEGGRISKTPKRTPAAAERVDDGEWRLDHAVALNISLRSLSSMPGAVVLLEVMHLKQRRSKGQKESLRAWTFIRVQDVLRALLYGEEYEVQHGTMDLALYRKPSDPTLRRLHRMSTKKYANQLTVCVGVDGSS